MDEEKVIKLQIEKQKEKEVEKQPENKRLHTNPILQKMLSINQASQKMKFKFKDLFR